MSTLMYRDTVVFRSKSALSSLCRPVACLLFAIFATSHFASPAAADHFECYLLAGQSNMDGRGLNEDLPKPLQQPMQDAIIFYCNPPLKTETWQPVQPGFSRPPRYKDPLPSPKFGPEIGFIQELRKSKPHQKIAIIKASEGGTNLRSDWQPGDADDITSQGPCYRNLIQTIKEATTKLEAEGHTFHLSAVLWHQGESDSKSNPETHQERLTQLIARLRADCDSPNLPVILGQVFDNGKRDKVRTAIKATASAVDNVGYVESDKLTTWDEGTHFDAASQLVLGQRFAAAVLKFADDSENGTDHPTQK